MVDFWQKLGRAGRFGLVAGVLAILGVTAGVAYLTLRTEYQVLFADLTAPDASAIVAELERQKIPFTVEEREPGGTTILVDRNDVYRTRIKMMGGDVPLHGAVGFELFNNSDFGMTEFAQKVNFQRALQGELTRTILSLAEVRDARVLLALPEQGLFKQATAKPKASITLSLRQGQALRPEQVTGIQRLVAAAVPAIGSEDVTIVDQRGVALTRLAGDGQGEGASSQLDLKKDAEKYLSRKASEVLEQALGPGQALASVDVTLDLDRVSTTTDDVLAAPGRQGQPQLGTVVRERETARELGAPLGARPVDGGASSVGGSTQREVEYAVGRRMEQVVKQPGSIRRLHVVAVVKPMLDTAQQEQIAKMLAASVGASSERGDTVVVQSIAAMNAHETPESAGAHPPAREGALAAAAQTPRSGDRAQAPFGRELLAGTGRTVGLVAIAVAAAVLLVSLRRRHAARRAARASPALSEAQREAALLQLQGWLRDGREPRTPKEAA